MTAICTVSDHSYTRVARPFFWSLVLAVVSGIVVAVVSVVIFIQHYADKSALAPRPSECSRCAPSMLNGLM